MRCRLSEKSAPPKTIYNDPNIACFRYHRLLRWPNIRTTLGCRLESAGIEQEVGIKSRVTAISHCHYYPRAMVSVILTIKIGIYYHLEGGGCANSHYIFLKAIYLEMSFLHHSSLDSVALLFYSYNSMNSGPIYIWKCILAAFLNVYFSKYSMRVLFSFVHAKGETIILLCQ